MQIFNRFRNSFKYNKDTNRELNRELIERSLAAAPGFFMSAAWVAYKQFGSVLYASQIRFLGSALMFLAAVRFLITFFEKKKIIDFEKAVFYTKANIVINGLFWMVTLLVPIAEYKFQHAVSNIIIVALVVGFSLSSMVTISYNLILAYFFQWIITIPTAVFLYYLANNEANEAAFNAAVVITIVFLYMLNQTRMVHQQIVHRLTYALDLENTNKLLKTSQDDLIQEKAKLQHSIRLAAVGEISGEIAHEINNPLGLIVGYIELASQELQNPNPNRELVENKLARARLAMSRITKIIKGLRHYARSTVNDPFLPVFVNEILEDAIDFCSEKFNYHRVDIEINSSEDIKVMCRTVEISQVFLNIFTNAIDELTKIPPEERKIQVRVLKDKNKVLVLISNSGAKIKPEFQDKLFEPFFSTKKVGIGTGLGLSISRNIVENHNGRLYYDPNEKQTTFVIELPGLPG